MIDDAELTPPVKTDPALAWLVAEGLPAFALVVQNSSSARLIRGTFNAMVQEFQDRVDGFHR